MASKMCLVVTRHKTWKQKSGTAAMDDHVNCPPENPHLQGEAHVGNVVKICFHLAASALDPFDVSQFGLRQATYPGPNSMPFAIPGHLVEILNCVVETVWTRSDQTHFAPQDIDDLRKFIDTRFPQKTAQF